MNTFCLLVNLLATKPAPNTFRLYFAYYMQMQSPVFNGYGEYSLRDALNGNASVSR